jgi:hypothetical protein
MDANQQNNRSTDDGAGPGTYHRASRRQRREERRMARAGRWGGPWIGGAILILLGILLLVQPFTSISLDNWWALLILIPAIGAFGNAWRTWQTAGGGSTASAWGSLIGGIVLTMVAAMFLFDLNWSVLGPALLMLGGIGIFLTAFIGQKSS